MFSEAYHRYWHFNIELNEIFVNMFLRSFGLSMIGIFVPLYFLEQGIALELILLQYFAIMYAVTLVTNVVAARLIWVIGLKHTIMLSLPFLVAQLVLLHLYSSFPAPLSVIASFGGVALSLYWMGLHTDFALAADVRREGAESGVMFIAVRLASVFGPVIGGLVLTIYGFPALFLVALAIVMLSAAPLLRTADVKRPEASPWTAYVTLTNVRYAIRFFVDGFRVVVEGILWPVFIYFVVKDFVGVGAAGSLAILGSALFSGLFGKIADKIGSTRLLRIMALPMAIFYYLMPLAQTEVLVLAISMVIGVISVGVDLPIYRSFIRHAKRNDIVGYTLFRETLMNMGKIIGLFVVAFTVDKFGAGFYMASLLSLFLTV